MLQSSRSAPALLVKAHRAFGRAQGVRIGRRSLLWWPQRYLCPRTCIWVYANEAESCSIIHSQNTYQVEHKVFALAEYPYFDSHSGS